MLKNYCQSYLRYIFYNLIQFLFIYVHTQQPKIQLQSEHELRKRNKTQNIKKYILYILNNNN
jgi:hypothetical protein